MKIIAVIASLFLIVSSVTVTAVRFNGFSDDREKLWTEVEQAINQGLPRTAMDKLKLIIESAKQDAAYPEAIKAWSQLLFQEGQVQEGDPSVYVVQKLREEIDSQPVEMRPVLRVILADWMFSYYMNNRWQFMDRTATGDQPGDDFRTWDGAQIIRECDRLFTNVLEDAEALQQIPIATYDELLTKSDFSDRYRPTLFDFIAYRAIAFYLIEEQFPRSTNAFDLPASSPVLGDAREFVTWTPETDDQESRLLKAINIFQQIMALNANNEDPSPRLDADLARLKFGFDEAFGDEKDARYKAALERFIEANLEHETSSLALSRLADLVHQEGDWTQAHAIATRGLNLHPESPGGNACFNRIQMIETQECNFHCERVWNEPASSIEITYRNIEKVYFRMVHSEYAQDFRGNASHQHNRVADLLKQRPVAGWSVDVPATEDFKHRTISTDIKLDVSPGRYFLLASIDDNFSTESNIGAYAEVWVSDLAIVMRSGGQSDPIQGIVTDALTGQPITGAQVQAWSYNHRASRFDTLDPTTTNQHGIFSLGSNRQEMHHILVKHGNQQLAVANAVYPSGMHAEPERWTRTQFFSDRAIYRPGQTVYFKGICFSSDQAKNEYSVVPNRTMDVELRDPNNEVVQTLRVRTNEFGSFQGNFTAPRGSVTGQYTVVTRNGPSGSHRFRVEEYKRPKFYVELEKPKEASRLGQSVEVSGKATAYTGAAIDGAQVQWKVTREVRLPPWWYWRCWWFPPLPGDTQEIAFGTTMTEIDGSFSISFEATPDRTVPRESEPIFTYSVTADVIDTTGETRSNTTSVRVGYTALSAEIKLDDWQTSDQPVEIIVQSETLDEVALASSGMLTIARLKQPDSVQRQRFSTTRYPELPTTSGAADEPQVDLSDFKTWPADATVFEQNIEIDASGKFGQQVDLPAGAYRVVYTTADRFGEKVTAEYPFLVIDTSADSLAVKVPSLFDAPTWVVEPGGEFVAVWGTGYTQGRAYVEIEHRGKSLQAFWTDDATTQTTIKQPVTEELRGGFSIHVTFVRENRAYTYSRKVDVPWSNKELKIKWERFVSKLTPGGTETFTAIISGPDSQKVAAELVATLYDASLDAFVQHYWQSTFNAFYQDHSRLGFRFQNHWQVFNHFAWKPSGGYRNAEPTYRMFDPAVLPFSYFDHGMQNPTDRGFILRDGANLGGRMETFSEEASSAPQMGGAMEALTDAVSSVAAKLERVEAPGSSPDVDLSAVTARTNLQETAFFFPNLTTGDDGTVRIEFTIPEALTKWKFYGFAHDVELRSAFLADEVVTSKDLMVQPNAPRFLREGDKLEFSVKVTNRSATRQVGKVQLTFNDAMTDENMDSRLHNLQTEQVFELPADQSTSLYWTIDVPDFTGVLTYKAVGATERVSDGEEGFVPVLSRRILVTESLPLPIRGAETKSFEFDRLKESGNSDSLQSQAVTVQMTSNPAWYAVMSLPYLMEFPHECSEQVFNRMYANALAQHIANSDPRIRRIFDQWRGTDALDSPLKKNQDLLSVMIEETPWLLNANKETDARNNVGVLFDANRMKDEIDRAMQKLQQMQHDDGAWPWFPGGRSNDYITLYLVTGFGRLQHLGATIDPSMAVRGLGRIDRWLNGRYQELIRLKRDLSENHLDSITCLYLYGRSFFKDHPIDEASRVAFDYYLGQAKKYWLETGQRQSQGQLAIALKRYGDLETPGKIMASLKERAVVDEEMGMLWREGARSWWWYQAPIETQAIMIEAFDEVAGDAEAVELCKVWLLKQKQTQSWATTKATADAVYGLLMRGDQLLKSTALVSVSLGGEEIDPQDVEAGTGFYEQRFLRGEITPEMGDIEVTKSDAGVAWGSVHWQYLEDMSKITPYEGTPLQLKKQLYRKINTDRGKQLVEVSGPVNVGDELVTRVELRVDRAMEFIHLKDYRGSGTEPVDVLSQYRYQDGLAYYQSTRDTASHFFIEYLPRGTYVFEYSVRVQHRGQYQTGIASIQCMYAPEFNSHSGSISISVE